MIMSQEAQLLLNLLIRVPKWNSFIPVLGFALGRMPVLKVAYDCNSCNNRNGLMFLGTTTFSLPVTNYCNSCLVQAFTRIIAWFSLFVFLSVVRWSTVWGETRASSLFTFSTLGLHWSCVWAGPPPRLVGELLSSGWAARISPPTARTGSAPLSGWLAIQNSSCVNRKKACNPRCSLDTSIHNTVNVELMQLSGVWAERLTASAMIGALLGISHAFEIANSGLVFCCGFVLFFS